MSKFGVTKKGRGSTKRSKDKHLGEALDASFAAVTIKRTAPNFYAKVYQVVEQIPEGKVTTYGSIAEFLGMKGSSRMVGQALGALPEASGIPAHRVINRLGELSGAHHFGGFERMQRMLRKEHISFRGEAVDLEKHFWDPRSSQSEEESLTNRKPLRRKNVKGP